MDKYFANKQLKILIDKAFNGNVTTLTKLLNIKRPAISDYLNEKTGVGVEFGNRLKTLANVNPLWLFHGEGEMLLSKSNSYDLPPVLHAGNIAEDKAEYKASQDIIDIEKEKISTLSMVEGIVNTGMTNIHKLKLIASTLRTYESKTKTRLL